MSSPRILFVNHARTRCGVYEFGENILAAIRPSARYAFVGVECGSLADLRREVAAVKPHAIIYNYMPATMPWLVMPALRGAVVLNRIAAIPVPQIGIIHSILQGIGDAAVPGKLLRRGGRELANRLFDFYVAPDPTLWLNSSIVYKHGRPILDYVNRFPAPARTMIGSCGFAKEGYSDLVELVQREFDDATIRFNIPFATFGDADGRGAKAIAAQCRALVRKPGIELAITHDYLDRDGLLDFLAQNTINVFLRDNLGRGVASVLDYALAVDRPIAISPSPMFRHVLDAEPSIVVGERSLRAIIADGTRPLQRFVNAWSSANLRWEYERIIDSVLARGGRPRPPAPTRVRGIKERIMQTRRLGLRGLHNFGSDPAISGWTGGSSRHEEDAHRTKRAAGATYTPVNGELVFNRVLDDTARRLYAPTEQVIRSLVPKTFAKKHPKANVQQAFVLDTVFRHLGRYRAPKILCVGSFEDTACMALCKLGVVVDEIDPVFDYTVQEFATKPDTQRGGYDIVFSTSVIEHCPDDQTFLESVAQLLAPGGLFVMTCDYKDGWKPGDVKPGVCERLYTNADLERRLPRYMPECAFVERAPAWASPGSDAFAAECGYSFASFCVTRA